MLQLTSQVSGLSSLDQQNSPPEAKEGKYYHIILRERVEGKLGGTVALR